MIQYNAYFVESYGWFEDEQSVYIAMEYLPHGDLGGYLQRAAPLPEIEVQQIAHQILEGLSSMHRWDIAH